MSQDNQITLRGFVTAEPKFRQTAQTATPVTEIRVGSTPRRLNRETGEWQDLQTSYYTVKCWRRLAINAVGSLHKGDMVIVRGRFYMHSWVDSQQQPRVSLEIEADSVGHDLAYGWSHFLRGAAAPRGNQAGPGTGEPAGQDAAASGAVESEADGSDDDYAAASYAAESASAEPGETDAVPGPHRYDDPGDVNLQEPRGDELVASGETADLTVREPAEVPF